MSVSKMWANINISLIFKANVTIEYCGESKVI